MGFRAAAIDNLKGLTERVSKPAEGDDPVVTGDGQAQARPATSSGFDAAFYLATYPDIRAGLVGRSPRAPEAHWMQYGRREVLGGHRPASPDYDEEIYLASRPDVRQAIAAGAFVNGYDHWLRHGRSEILASDPVGPFERHPSSRPPILTEPMIRFWHENGYLVLKGLFSADRCDRVNRRIDALWDDRQSAPPVAIDTHLDTGAHRIRFADASIEDRVAPYKLYDLVMCDDTVQALALDPTLISVLHWVLNGDPACISSLNFERGSTQGFHQDTLYMPGQRPGGMTAAWIALEDVRPEAGPLGYYAGSHRIPLFHFSSGKPNQIDEEFDGYHLYMMDEVNARGIAPTTFLPTKGDVLIWNERLFHAGTPIQDRGPTRRSLVTHYWRARELPSGGVTRAAGGLFWDREWC